MIKLLSALWYVFEFIASTLGSVILIWMLVAILSHGVFSINVNGSEHCIGSGCPITTK